MDEVFRRGCARWLRTVRLFFQPCAVDFLETVTAGAAPLGADTAAGSFGLSLFAPFGAVLIDNFGLQSALTVFAALMLLIVPLSPALATLPATAANTPVERAVARPA